ncbi:hypothetical protein V6Z11_A13G187200 [Gossypium hirsutum]
MPFFVSLFFTFFFLPILCTFIFFLISTSDSTYSFFLSTPANPHFLVK